MMCINCKHAKHGRGTIIYCVLFGIFITGTHEGCKFDPDDSERSTRTARGKETVKVS